MTDWDDVPRFGRLPAGARAIARPSAYGLVTDGTERLAVVRTPKGFFLPGGAIEPGESPRDAIVRECREEVGLAVRLGEWTIRAVEFIYATIESAYFEKPNTFIEGFAHGPPVGTGEPDHELNWLVAEQAVGELLHASHRWAVAQWLAARSTS
jgi:8-oxo-dGTP diphosphatase